MSSVEDREVSLPIGVVVEKRKSSHPWAHWNWKTVAVFIDGSLPKGSHFAFHKVMTINSIMSEQCLWCYIAKIQKHCG